VGCIVTVANRIEAAAAAAVLESNISSNVFNKKHVPGKFGNFFFMGNFLN
jgi:hypothetical protein